jgi:hypothetical protein
MHELGTADEKADHSYWHQPSISEHPQNREFQDWTVLIDLARDAWLATLERSPERARLAAELWLTVPYPLFRRLAFFAATHLSLFTPHNALEWLLGDEHWWLWSVETQREAVRLLVSIASQLEAQDKTALEQAILKGPPREMFREDISEGDWVYVFDREMWLRLAKYQAAGADLGRDAASALFELWARYPEWRLADDDRDEFPSWTSDSIDHRAFLATPKRYCELVAWLRKHSKSADFWQEHDWRERCKRDFRRTSVALIRLAREDEWFPDRWREALQVWSDEALVLPAWHSVCSILATAPNEVTKGLAHTLS